MHEDKTAVGDMGALCGTCTTSESGHSAAAAAAVAPTRQPRLHHFYTRLFPLYRPSCPTSARARDFSASATSALVTLTFADSRQRPSRAAVARRVCSLVFPLQLRRRRKRHFAPRLSLPPPPTRRCLCIQPHRYRLVVSCLRLHIARGSYRSPRRALLCRRDHNNNNTA